GRPVVVVGHSPRWNRIRLPPTASVPARNTVITTGQVGQERIEGGPTLGMALGCPAITGSVVPGLWTIDWLCRAVGKGVRHRWPPSGRTAGAVPSRRSP